jgi:hypothetical protein
MAAITSISKLLDAIAETKLSEQKHAHVRVWFRGQGNQGWLLEPGVYRPGFAANEDERILNERHLSQDFLTMSVPLRDYRSDAETYFIQQHYRMPTRLLDWSLNPLAAAFFALEPANTDGKIFVLDAYRFQSEPPGRGLCTPRSKEVAGAMEAIFAWRDSTWPNRILPVRPTNIDPRIGAQHGCFTFHPPKERTLTTATNPTLKEWIVPVSAKTSLRKELELLGVDEFMIYGDLDHLAERLKRAYRP